MTINLMNNTNEDLSKYKSIMEQVINTSLDFVGCPYESEVTVTLTDNKEIHTYNKMYREKDSATDVLSFPLIDFSEPGDFTGIDEEDDEYFNLDSGELMLGDIVISYEKAYAQADEYGHTLEREIGFLIAHSMLHLMGYDHMNTEDEELMKEKQEVILEKVGLKR